MTRKTVYIDMDGTIVDFQSGIDRLPDEIRARFPGDKNIDEAEGIFGLMDPLPGAIEGVKKLAKSEKLDVYILSTAPWLNASAWADKLKWIQTHFGHEKDSPLYKRVILTHHKELNTGDFLIDDRKKNGAERFNGLHIYFGEFNEEDQRDGTFPDWASVISFFEKQGLLHDDYISTWGSDYELEYYRGKLDGLSDDEASRRANRALEED